MLTLTWLVYWIRTARSVFTGAGLKWPNTAGQYSTQLSHGIISFEKLTTYLINLSSVHTQSCHGWFFNAWTNWLAAWCLALHTVHFTRSKLVSIGNCVENWYAWKKCISDFILMGIYWSLSKNGGFWPVKTAKTSKLTQSSGKKSNHEIYIWKLYACWHQKELFVLSRWIFIFRLLNGKLCCISRYFPRFLRCLRQLQDHGWEKSSIPGPKVLRHSAQLIDWLIRLLHGLFIR